MMAALNLKSKGRIRALLDGLEERRFIRRLKGKSRAIELVHRDVSLSSVSTEALLDELRRRIDQDTVRDTLPWLSAQSRGRPQLATAQTFNRT